MVARRVVAGPTRSSRQAFFNSLMADQPTLRSTRLLLRPLALLDAPAVQSLAGTAAVADTTLRIPHPYPDGAAETWIASLTPEWESGSGATFAITERDRECLVGVVGLTISEQRTTAELGYWIGQPYWNRGYATEAAQTLLDWGMVALHLDRIMARHFVRNPASGRVLQKIGMTRESGVNESIEKNGRLEEFAKYFLLAAER